MWDQVAPPTRALNRLTIGLDDRVLTVSEASRLALPAAARRRAEVVVHGIELEPIHDALRRRDELRGSVRTELGLSDGELLSLTVANFRAQKGYDVLLKAARGVADRGVPVCFVAAGDGPLRRDLERQRAELSLERHVKFLGERSDVVRLLAAADMFVLPSRYEGLPLALMEAVSMGVPVVATAVSGLPDLLTDERDALLVAPEQPEALTDAIARLAGDPDLRAGLSAGARELSERFDVRRCVLEVEAVYDQLRPEPVPVAR
jgi:glycosyltransferase involved in cell wall biosynthesis